jgi:hypothetical protein
LADFQYVIDNIDDSYFREHGDFALPEGKREYGLIIGVIAAILFLIIMALLN